MNARKKTLIGEKNSVNFHWQVRSFSFLSYQWAVFYAFVL